VEKKRILIMTDSPRIKTGFANIGRHVAQYLHDSGQWDVHYIGWFDSPVNSEIPINYRLYTTARTQEGQQIREDVYAYMSFKSIHDQVKPDVVWVCGDGWMQAAYQWHYSDKDTRPHFACSYTPIDSGPVASVTRHAGGPTNEFLLDWGEHFKKFDDVIAYCNYGKDLINKRCESEVVKTIIHHGADTKVYHPLPKNERLRIRRELLGVPDDAFLITTVARNQPRKSYPEMIAAIKYFIDHSERADKKVVYYAHCFTPGTLVPSTNGVTRIEDVLIDDTVITHTGKVSRVIENSKRHYEGKVYSIRALGDSHTITCTPEHKIYAIRGSKCNRSNKQCTTNCKSQIKLYKPTGAEMNNCNTKHYLDYAPEWIEASDLKIGDYLLVPKVEKQTTPLQNIIIDDISGNRKVNDFNTNIPIDEDMMLLLGYYIAEGCVGSSKCYTVVWTFNINEKEYISDVKRICKDKFGLDVNLYDNVDTNVTTISVGCRSVSKWFYDNFGHGARNKTVPEWIYSLSPNLIASFIKGWWRGDGWRCKEGQYRYRMKLTTASTSAAYQLADLLMMCNIIPCVRHNRLGWYEVVVNGIEYNKLAELMGIVPVKRTNAWNKHFMYNDYACFRITTIKTDDYSGYVYNLQVEGDETYRVGRFAVHNCPLQDVGWNLPDLIKSSGLSYRNITQHYKDSKTNELVVGPHRIILNESLQVGQGPSDEQLNEIYNAADTCMFIYTSEGWALPPHEAMAAGVPTIMTDYSAPADWARGKTLFVKPLMLTPEPVTNLLKAIHRPEDISRAIHTMYTNKDNIRQKLVKAGLEFARENDWPIIQQQWLDYFNSLELKPREHVREVIRLSDADSLVPEVTNKIPEQTMPKVSIIIPTQNGGQMLQNCINSIRNSGWGNYEIIIADNGSWDKVSKELLTVYRNEGYKIVEWRKKYVPSKVLNLASNEASGEFLLFLDNDTTLQPGAIHKMLECFTNDKVGISTLKLAHPQNPNVGVTGYNYDNRLGFVPVTDGEGIVQRAAVSGTCLMIPKILFNVIGGYDESYTLLWQDIDLCMKVSKLGKVTVCNTTSTVLHLGGVTRRHFMSKSAHSIDYIKLVRRWWPEYTVKHDKHHVAVIKLVSLGDCVACTPILKKIREKYPKSYITLYTTIEYSDIFNNNPHIDEVKTVGPIDKNLFGPTWSLMAYDAITFNIANSEPWDVFVELSTLSAWHEYRREPNSLSQHYANMADITLDDDLYDVYPSPENNRVAEQYDKQYPGDGPLVIMHTTAGWSLKEWTKEGFAEIARRLVEKYGARIYVLGAKGEKLGSIYTRDICGELTLRDQVSLMNRAKLFVGNDSGLLHASKASNKCAILGLFGNTSIDVVGFRGVKKYIALESPYAGEVSCGSTTCIYSEANKKEGKECLPCMQRLSIEDVWFSVQRLMDNEEVHEYRKGTNLCETRFFDSEWHTQLLEGELSEGYCTYIGGGVLP
jgi:ADP-heptose:LPS heptosyltransferase/GT2 family glycosyltransferase/glycosyltransferase involved in cell wall biosynthesis